MYKIEYTKFPIMADGSAGNIARGCGVACADCELSSGMYGYVEITGGCCGEENKIYKMYPLQRLWESSQNEKASEVVR